MIHIFSQSFIPLPDNPDNSRGKNSDTSNKDSTTPEVRGNGPTIDQIPIGKRSPSKPKDINNATYVSSSSTQKEPKKEPKKESKKSPTPPPPPPPSLPKMTSGKGSVTDKTLSADHAAQHLKNIRDGVQLRKTKTNDRSSVNQQETRKTSKSQVTEEFMSAADYLFHGAWGTYKDRLKKKIITSGGIATTNNEDLNILMINHAKYAKKTGTVDAVTGDIDSEGNRKKSDNVIKTVYESYVLGRDQTYDRNNDFNQNIDQYLDIYLSEVSKSALENETSLKNLMEEWFDIPAVVQTPQTFFVENKELNEQLKKTNCQVQWLTPKDITEDFIDGLIHFDKDKGKGKIVPLLNKIIAREQKKLDVQQEALSNFDNRVKSRFQRMFGRN